MMWKCTKCKAMVPGDQIKKHKCSTVADLKTGDKQRDGAVELAYLRGKQSKKESQK